MTTVFMILAGIYLWNRHEETQRFRHQKMMDEIKRRQS